MTMDEQELINTLNSLRNLPGETEIVEFKEAKNTFGFSDIGKYFSALSNEANLKGRPFAWLIFGVENKTFQVVGSRFRENRKCLDSLKNEIANKTTSRITFIEIHELRLLEGRVVMFQIPAAPQGIPVAFEGHYYGRDGESLVPLNIEEIERIRTHLIKTHSLSEKIDWNKVQFALELTITNLLGSWNEKSEADKTIAGQLAKEDFTNWIFNVREILQQPESPVALKNGIWTVTKRQELWQALGPRLFDDHLDIFKQCVVTVLTERDPQFDLTPEERYTAVIHGKVLKHSHQLRKGLAESLALLGSYPSALNNCLPGKPETVAVLAVREIFVNADWILWGSLNNLLPLLAEAAPKEFLCTVESALQMAPCPFDILFSQEGNGITGGNYLTGLLWALETLAWDEQYLVQVTVLLGELASHDPGCNRANRPVSSLSTIFLPWLPQTMASIEKRKVAVQTLQKEFPEIAWKLLLILLPNQRQMSIGAHKPVWRKTIPEDWTKGVPRKEYWDQGSFYAGIAVEMAKGDTAKLNELIGHLDNLPQPSFGKILAHLSSKEITAKPEDLRTSLWNKLITFILKHKRYTDAKWALGPDLVAKIEDVAAKLAPQNPSNLHRRLFSGHNFSLYEEKGDWQEQQKKLEDRRQKAIRDILVSDGIEAVVQFAETVESPWNAGLSLGFIAEAGTDSVVLPSLLEVQSKKLTQFASGFVWGRLQSQGWAWVDKINTTGWSQSQIGQFLAFLPFTDETWKRSNSLLREAEAEYWNKASVNPYQAECELQLAIDKLIKYDRPNAAIDCLYKILDDKKPLDQDRTVKALLSAVASTEPAYSMDVYNIVEIIKALQDDKTTNPEDLFRIEWSYLRLLDRDQGASPRLLEQRLASDPDFFCEVIRLIYRSTKETISDKEPTEQQKAIATNAWRLLHEWETPPGTQIDVSFSDEHFNKWINSVKTTCSDSGHLEVALSHIGNVLIHCPPDSDGLWINRAVAEALNGKDKDADKMRNGFHRGILNSRGVHWVDPTGKPEKELAAKYRQQAEDVENAGFQRFAITLRSIADDYDQEAKRIVEKSHKSL